MDKKLDVVVIGGGQAGLSAGYHLAQSGLSFAILEAHDRVGESWRRRWDTLRVFTRTVYDGLPNMPFPGPAGHYPSKDDVADYLGSYRQRIRLPVVLDARVDRLTRDDGGQGFVAHVGDDRYVANHVLAASGAWHEPRIPAFASGLRPDICQLHSSEYRGEAQLQPGPVLVVGAANSGSEIAYNAAREHETWLVGRDVGQMPFAINGRIARLVDPFIWFMANHVLTVSNPIGRRARPAMRDRGNPLERIRRGDLERVGVRRVLARASGVRDGLPQLDDGRVLDVANVVWATGFVHEYPWIQLERPVIGEDGWPQQTRGASTAVPGLYFLGVPYMQSMGSPLIGGVGRDARRVVDSLVASTATGHTSQAPQASQAT